MFFPLEFDLNIYKNENPHLRYMNNSQLIHHYNYYGINEGLISSQIKNRNDFINLVPKNLLTLEIGPLCNPCMNVNSDNVHVLDYFSQEELKENYKNDPNVNINNICKVDYIVKGISKYNTIISHKYDCCFSSHNIEHTPCLITFLNNISSILKNNSYFFLCIPDYRYCFDYFRNPTNIFEILNSFYNKHYKPSPISILESKYLTCHNDSIKHWDIFNKSIKNIFIDINEKKNLLNNQKEVIINDIEYIKNIYNNSHENNYIDSHVWKFTPFIFKTIIDILYQTNYIDLKIERVYKTLKNSNEFYVILKKN